MKLVFVHVCGLMPNGYDCPADTLAVHIEAVPVDVSAYVVPTVRCIHTHNELQLQQVDGKFV